MTFLAWTNPWRLQCGNLYCHSSEIPHFFYLVMDYDIMLCQKLWRQSWFLFEGVGWTVISNTYEAPFVKVESKSFPGGDEARVVDF